MSSRSHRNIPRNVMVSKIIPTKPQTLANLKTLVAASMTSKEFKELLDPYIKPYKKQYLLSKLLNKYTYVLFSRNPREERPSNLRLMSAPTKPYSISRELVKAKSPYVNKRRANLAKRMNERNALLNKIRNSNKEILGVSGRIGNGEYGINFKTIPNGKKYTWFSNKTLHGMNTGIPKRNIPKYMVFRKKNRLTSV